MFRTTDCDQGYLPEVQAHPSLDVIRVRNYKNPIQFAASM